MQQQAADSPNRNVLLVPPLMSSNETPRTSRVPNEPIKGQSPSDKRRMGSKSSSPVVSSTVNTYDSGDDREAQTVSPQSEDVLPPPFDQNDRLSHIAENGNQIGVEQQEKDVFAKPPDEELFRRPQIVPRQSQKQNKAETVCVLCCFNSNRISKLLLISR